MIEWMEEYATGVQLVDIQHRALIQQINRLEAILRRPEIDPVEVERLLGFLSHYIVGHFRFEENCMKRRSCPAYAANCSAHEEFIARLTEFKTQFDANGLNRELLAQLLEHTQGWIKNHILKIDLELKKTVTRSAF
jgi:hemerythrin